jgi:putative sterol carrier protein
MTKLPSRPVSPAEFIEDVIPAVFAETEVGDEERKLDLKLGICLRGEGGGDWTLHFVQGELGIAEGRDPDCAVTVVQSVADWRAALWEGRPGLVSDLVQRVAERGAAGLSPPGIDVSPRNPAALEGLRELQGMIEAIVSSDEGPDWRVDVQIGAGPIPEHPQATIRIGAAQAEAIRRGELHPLEALITGQLRLEGDLGLILQLQAIAMTATMPPPAP